MNFVELSKRQCNKNIADILTLHKITSLQAIKMIKFVRTHHIVENHFVENHKNGKQLVDHFVKTTYGIFYPWHQKPKGLKRALKSVRR